MSVRPSRMLGLLVLGIGSLAPPLHAAAPLQLKPFEAEFQVKRDGIPLGTLELRLALSSPQGYKYTSHTRPGPLIGWLISDEVQETSEGLYVDKQITPLTYEYRQGSGKVEKKHTLLNFDWSAGQVWTESEGVRWPQPIEPGVQDKFSQQLALRLDLASGKTLIGYAAADGGKIKTYRYKVTGEEFISVPYGRVKCLRVRRSKEAKAADSTIWVAPELGFFPVKIERRRTSGRYSMELRQLSSGG
ncbi:MAG: DUF3108 domain-containing protein [Pseudomonadota bacterium]